MSEDRNLRATIKKLNLRASHDSHTIAKLSACITSHEMHYDSLARKMLSIQERLEAVSESEEYETAEAVNSIVKFIKSLGLYVHPETKKS